MKWQAIFGRFAADFRMLATMTFVTNGGCGEHGQRKIWRVVVKHLPSGELSGIASAACEDVLKQSSHFFFGFFWREKTAHALERSAEVLDFFIARVESPYAVNREGVATLYSPT
jgi:hypothetical protein